MAIAYDTTSTLQTSGGTNSLTYAFSPSGSNLILFVYISSDTGSDSITGVTFNGVAMTQDKKLQDAGQTNWSYVYRLNGPATGSHNVVISSSASGFFYSYASSYTGAAQSGQPDGVAGSVVSSTTITETITTATDNCWGFAGCRSYAGNVSSGTNFTVRPAASSITIGDSNGPKTPAGSFSMTANVLSGAADMIMVTFSPFVAPSINGAFLYEMM